MSHDDGTSQPVAILGRDFHRHEAAKAMSDNEGALAQLGSGHHGTDFFGAKLGGVVRSPPTIAHAGQINRRDAKVAGEVRRNIAPPVAMRTAAMDEEKAAFARLRRLSRPNQVMDWAVRYRYELRLAGTGNSPPKPIRRRRTDRQQIGWYGFAAQRGCTHIIASTATDRPTSYRMKDPARSLALRQQRNLAVRGASSMLEHSALLFRSGRIRGHISVSPSSGPRVRIHLPPAESPRLDAPLPST